MEKVPTQYIVHVSQDGNGGTVRWLGDNLVTAGDSFELLVRVDDGYEALVSAVDADGMPVKVIDHDHGNYTINEVNSDIEVTVTFVEVEEPEVTKIEVDLGGYSDKLFRNEHDTLFQIHRRGNKWDFADDIKLKVYRGDSKTPDILDAEDMFDLAKEDKLHILCDGRKWKYNQQFRDANDSYTFKIVYEGKEALFNVNVKE